MWPEHSSIMHTRCFENSLYQKQVLELDGGSSEIRGLMSNSSSGGMRDLASHLPCWYSSTLVEYEE